MSKIGNENFLKLFQNYQRLVAYNNSDNKNSVEERKINQEKNNLLDIDSLFDLNNDNVLDQKDIELFLKGDVNGDKTVTDEEKAFTQALKKDLKNIFVNKNINFELDGKAYRATTSGNTQYYRENGKIISRTVQNNDGTKIRYGYDYVNNVRILSSRTTTEKDGSNTTYYYDKNNNVVQRTVVDKNNNKTVYHYTYADGKKDTCTKDLYNADNVLTSSTEYNYVNGTAVKQRELQYDENGELKKINVSNCDITEETKYDKNGNLIKEIKIYRLASEKLYMLPITDGLNLEDIVKVSANTDTTFTVHTGDKTYFYIPTYVSSTKNEYNYMTVTDAADTTLFEKGVLTVTSPVKATVSSCNISEESKYDINGNLLSKEFKMYQTGSGQTYTMPIPEGLDVTKMTKVHAYNGKFYIAAENKLYTFTKDKAKSTELQQKYGAAAAETPRLVSHCTYTVSGQEPNQTIQFLPIPGSQGSIEYYEMPLPAGVNPEDITKVSNNKENKTFTVVANGKTYLFGVTESATNHFNFTLYNGMFNDKLYENGTLFTGIFEEKLYKNGILFSGTLDDKFYQNGVAFSGIQGNKLYENGTLFTGIHEEKYYADGVVVAGQTATNEFDENEKIKISYIYDANKKLLAKTTYTYDDKGEEKHHITNYAYNGNSRWTKALQTNADGSTVQYERVFSDADTYTRTESSYNKDGKLTKVVEKDGQYINKKENDSFIKETIYGDTSVTTHETWFKDTDGKWHWTKGKETNNDGSWIDYTRKFDDNKIISQTNKKYDKDGNLEYTTVHSVFNSNGDWTTATRTNADESEIEYSRTYDDKNTKELKTWTETWYDKEKKKMYTIVCEDFIDNDRKKWEKATRTNADRSTIEYVRQYRTDGSYSQHIIKKDSNKVMTEESITDYNKDGKEQTSLHYQSQYPDKYHFRIYNHDANGETVNRPRITFNKSDYDRYVQNNLKNPVGNSFDDAYKMFLDEKEAYSVINNGQTLKIDENKSKIYPLQVKIYNYEKGSNETKAVVYETDYNNKGKITSQRFAKFHITSADKNGNYQWVYEWNDGMTEYWNYNDTKLRETVAKIYDTYLEITVYNSANSELGKVELSTAQYKFESGILYQKTKDGYEPVTGEIGRFMFVGGRPKTGEYNGSNYVNGEKILLLS